ncbi:cytochrome o ubiquinol oxidase subunit IV [Pseudomonas capsici]|uniref:Cytochrome bo(3) ubiquinol oxidase subunit 4 n=1 Tax=Pseudomonas capsici TaxID=2810614 RepID=A0ABT3C343_9PSED|nr:MULTISPECIES: cytochrome o ubiquinol oxidase subunit IV [Pseudomonas]MBN6714019.1 cytochrome o ubiquinol oxidase subunit IV [Pseudomonas capsici]MBN6719425.1 cytochrome o ubiquinol oxidase subunit IV [Pseudomonas capsici]MBN6722761.1 cytochrome o ubiquinol oxidase subunit IV [Pseudomonas capsici]MBX8474683.1 cytochrome o ubiquinol oxidase subunit IV [Pseudomonas cichorii]MBX8610277.1 cytochrome o ubiquinol oxidase subunit IV [Pseudomonas cichorii]
MANSHHPAEDHSHGSVKSYIIGFVLSIILTAIPFALVMSPVLPKDLTIAIILAFAVVQILVHLHYFLHLDFTSAQRNNVMAFAFTTLVIVLLVGLSLWIIFSIHREMMAH